MSQYVNSNSSLKMCVICVHAQLFLTCPTLCDSMDCSPPDSSDHGILQARILEWIAMPSSRGSFDSVMEPVSLMFHAFVGRFFTTSATWEAHFMSQRQPNFLNNCIVIRFLTMHFVIYRLSFSYSDTFTKKYL